MYIIAGKLSCKPDTIGKMTALATKLTTLSRRESGCISYCFYEDKTVPGDFLFFEEWRDRKDIDVHFQKPYFLAAMKEFPHLISGAPVIKIYQIANVEEM